MKKNILTFLAVLLASLIAYGGSGVNIFFYCCDDCRAEGVEAVIGDTCCELHHHHHLNGLITHFDEHTCNQHLAGTPEECGVERISVLWESTSNNNPGVEPLSFYLAHSLSALIPSAKLSSDVTPLIGSVNPATQKPPHQSKAEYFSLLTTLII
jgi:hypothetical protein